MLGFPGVFHAVTMNMSVDEIAGLIALDKATKDFESTMAEVGFIVNPKRWSVGDENIDGAFMEEFGAQQAGFHLLKFPPHLMFGILFRPSIVAHAAFKTAD